MKKTIAIILVIASMFLLFAEGSEWSSLNGKLDELVDKWFVKDPSVYSIDYRVTCQ